MNLSRNERIAVVLALAVIALFFGGFAVFGIARQTAPASDAPLVTSESGLIMQDVSVGTGVEAVSGSTATVHYVGRLPDGREFDSSVSRGTPFTFTIGQGEVIKGWEEGLLGMKVGGKRLLVIPPSLGYGERGIGPIPPNATLVFEIDLLDVR